MTGYVVHGVALAFAWFGVANLFVSGAVAIVARRLAHRGRRRTPGWWLTLRSLPALASLAFVAAVFLPSYLQFEPRETIEGIDVTLTLCASVGLGIVLLAGVRGVRAARRAARQALVWMRSSHPLDAVASPVPAYTIGSAPIPLMALVGLVSPRVFVSQRLVDTLTREELDVTLAHEASHAHARDNLKRLLIRMLPDALGGTAAAAAIERRWASAAEHAADRAATNGNPAARCALASALVKVARLMPPTSVRLEPISTLVCDGDLASRVESLLAEPATAASSRAALWSTAATLAALVVAYAPLLRAVHEITEVLVNSLP